MNNDIILLDGIRYCRYSPKSEDEFRQLIVDNIAELFGKEAIYIDIEKNLENEIGKARRPDGFVFDLTNNSFFVVEFELSNHSTYGHIDPQINGFLQAVDNWNTRQKIAGILKKYMEEDLMRLKAIKDHIGDTSELYQFFLECVLTPMHNSGQPNTYIIIDECSVELEIAMRHRTPKPKLIEAAVYAREGAEMVKALRFEPQFTFVPQATETSPVPLKEIKKSEPLPSNSNTQFPIPVYATYKGKRYEAKLFADGSMEVDGEKFPAPSSAGSAVRGGKPVNGWDFWRLSPVRGADSIQTVRGSIDGQAKIERKELPIGYENDKALPEKAYRLPLLKAIIENGGKITPKEADERVFEIMKKNLSEADHENLDSGPVRWKRWIKWARFHLAKEGLLVHPGKRGIWEVTDKGRDYFEKHKGEI